MSRLRVLLVPLAFATLATASIAFSQENPSKSDQPKPVKPGQQIGNPSQPGQPLDDTSRRTDRVPGSTQIGAGDNTNSTAQRQNQSAGTDANHQPVNVKQAIIKKLTRANDAEIELAKLAQQKTDNPELRQLTQTIIQDHQALNQQLEKLGHSANSNQNPATRTNQTGAAGQASSANSDIVPQQLCRIMEKACDNARQMTKEMLQKHEGQDFQMAYLSQQCVAHSMMLAELRAIESDGPQELQQVAQQAAVKVENHLKQAKQLAQKHKDSEHK
jgi:predicted outer membrane protein